MASNQDLIPVGGGDDDSGAPPPSGPRGNSQVEALLNGTPAEEVIDLGREPYDEDPVPTRRSGAPRTKGPGLGRSGIDNSVLNELQALQSDGRAPDVIDPELAAELQGLQESANPTVISVERLLPTHYFGKPVQLGYCGTIDSAAKGGIRETIKSRFGGGTYRISCPAIKKSLKPIKINGQPLPLDEEEQRMIEENGMTPDGKPFEDLDTSSGGGTTPGRPLGGLGAGSPWNPFTPSAANGAVGMAQSPYGHPHDLTNEIRDMGWVWSEGQRRHIWTGPGLQPTHPAPLSSGPRGRRGIRGSYLHKSGDEEDAMEAQLAQLQKEIDERKRADELRALEQRLAPANKGPDPMIALTEFMRQQQQAAEQERRARAEEDRKYREEERRRDEERRREEAKQAEIERKEEARRREEEKKEYDRRRDEERKEEARKREEEKKEQLRREEDYRRRDEEYRRRVEEEARKRDEREAEWRREDARRRDEERKDEIRRQETMARAEIERREGDLRRWAEQTKAEQERRDSERKIEEERRERERREDREREEKRAAEHRAQQEKLFELMLAQKDSGGIASKLEEFRAIKETFGEAAAEPDEGERLTRTMEAVGGLISNNVVPAAAQAVAAWRGTGPYAPPATPNPPQQIPQAPAPQQQIPQAPALQQIPGPAPGGRQLAGPVDPHAQIPLPMRVGPDGQPLVVAAQGLAPAVVAPQPPQAPVPQAQPPAQPQPQAPVAAPEEGLSPEAQGMLIQRLIQAYQAKINPAETARGIEKFCENRGIGSELMKSWLGDETPESVKAKLVLFSTVAPAEQQQGLKEAIEILSSPEGADWFDEVADTVVGVVEEE
jgi:hypothetical protein